MLAVEEVLEFNRVPDELRVSLVVRTLWGIVAAWWKQLKQSRVRQSKLKINSWEKLLKYMQVAFLPHNYIMGQKLLNWRQWFMFVTKKIEKSYQKKVFREI